MGQAKQRGTFEQRQQQAIEANGHFLERISEPLDIETFKYAYSVLMAAGSLKMPVENPKNRIAFVDEEAGREYRFGDIPMNRGMLALSAELREMGVDNQQAYIMRLMQMHQVYDQRKGILAGYFKDCGEDKIMVSLDLIEAMAVAKFTFPSAEEMENPGVDEFGFDIDDLAAKAAERAKLNESE